MKCSGSVQRTEFRIQRTEFRVQSSEYRRPRSEYRGQIAYGYATAHRLPGWILHLATLFVDMARYHRIRWRISDKVLHDPVSQR